MSRRDVVLVISVLALVVGGISLQRPSALASASDDVVVVLYDATADLSDLTTELDLADWSVTIDHSTLGVMQIEPDGVLSAATSVLLTTLSALPAVRAAEEEQDMLLQRDLNGKQSIFIEFDDDLDAADIRPQTSFSLMGVPATAPTASQYTPSIAFLDGGFMAHDALPTAAIAGQFDALDNDADAMDSGNNVDDDGDGVIDGGVGHGLGMAGSALVMCPHADVYLVRVLNDEGQGGIMSLAAGISWAIQEGVDVINISAGMANSSPMIDMLIDDAIDDDIIVVASAGNDGAEDQYYPGSHPDVIGVGGVDEAGEVHTVSNYETGIFISAPSAAVAGAFPDNSDDYGWWNGTSMSAALVAGAAAYLTGESPNDPNGVLGDLETNASAIVNTPTPRIGKVGHGFLDITGL